MLDATDYWKILNHVRLIGKNRFGQYVYAKLVCARYHVGDDLPFRIDIFKAPLDLGRFSPYTPYRLYFAKDDQFRVVHVEVAYDVVEDENDLLPFDNLPY